MSPGNFDRCLPYTAELDKVMVILRSGNGRCEFRMPVSFIAAIIAERKGNRIPPYQAIIDPYPQIQSKVKEFKSFTRPCL